MQTLSEIKALLAARGLRPRHRYGQNFLHDKNQLLKLVESAEVRPKALVLEVGPGTGTLTEALLDRGAEVIASEIDRDLADLLEERLGTRITLVRGDCLHRGRHLAAPLQESLAGRPFTLVANLPYQVASPLMVALLIDHPECRGQFVTIQKEVADRLTAVPGTKAYGPLGVIVQALATVERVAIVRPTSFWPVPQVDSAMVAIRPRPDHGVEEPASFARFASELFGRRRKQLGTILGREVEWPDGISPTQRPEQLTVPQLVALWRIGRERGDG